MIWLAKCVGKYYFEHFLVFVSAGSVCFNFRFASLVGVSVGIVSSAVGLKICTLTAGIKNYISIFKRKRKNDNNSDHGLLYNTVRYVALRDKN